MTNDHEIVSGVTEKILTHELGAGSPCLKCKEKCPGLDLHFWRKICRNCKCKQEDHDVQSSISSKGIDNIGKLLQQDKEINLGVYKNEKAEYPTPKSSPKKKTPAVKSTPTPPIPPVKSGNHSHPPPTKSGNHSHPPPTAPKPYKKMEPVFTTKDDTSFTSTISLKVGPSTGSEASKVEDASSSWPAPPPPPPADDVTMDPLDLPPPPPSFDKSSDDVTHADVGGANVIDLGQQMNAMNISVDEAEERRSSSSSSSSSSDGEAEFDWMPAVDSRKLLEGYMAGLPKDKRPIVGTQGAQYRKRQLMKQLPSHDQNPNECHDLTEAEKNEMDLFVKQYREKALGVAKISESDKNKTCTGCDNKLSVGDVIIVADRAGEMKAWEPGCFTCTECNEILVDLIYFYNDDKLYCGRHYCELMKPRCTACDELIFAQEYTQAEDCFWHLKHFCCWQCDQPLGGKNYVPHENQPICVPCYEMQFAHTCSTCTNKIAPNTEWVTFESHHWHASDDCFKCSQCSQSLVGQKCIPKGELVFCSSKCKKAMLANDQ